MFNDAELQMILTALEHGGTGSYRTGGKPTDQDVLIEKIKRIKREGAPSIQLRPDEGIMDVSGI